MQLLSILMGLLAIGILIRGIISSISLISYLVIYVYFILVEVSNYNNHYYLVALFLFIFIISSFRNNYDNVNRSKFIQHLNPSTVYLLIFQTILVYVYGGIAKLNSDWLSGNVMRSVFESGAIKSYGVSIDFLVPFYTYSGLLIDLIIAPLLLFKPLRKFSIFILIIFHTINFLTLNIGIFPILMIGVIFLFLNIPKLEDFSFYTYSLVQKSIIAIFIIIQIVLPTVHYFIPGNVDWTGEGKFVSWRMKTPHKTVHEFEVFVFDNVTNVEYRPNVKISDQQLNALIYYPTLLPQFLKGLINKIPNKNACDIRFELNIITSMNGREKQAVYDRNFSICKLKNYSFRHNEWILPLE